VPDHGRPRRQIQSTDGPIEAFALELRALHQGAGFATQQQVATASHLSVSVVASATRGDDLPTWDTTKAVTVVACAAPKEVWQRRWIDAWGAARDAGRSVPLFPAELSALSPTPPIRAGSRTGAEPEVAPSSGHVPAPATVHVAADAGATSSTAEPDVDRPRDVAGRWAWLRSLSRRWIVVTTVVLIVSGGGVGTAWLLLHQPSPGCDDIGVAFDNVSSHRVHRQVWIDAYNAHGGRDALGCPRQEREQGLVHDWGPGVSQDLEKDGKPARLMSIDPDTVIVMSGDYFRDYTEPHWNLAAGRQGYPESDPFTCGNARVALLTRGEYDPGAMVTKPDGRFVWLPRPVLRRYLELGGPSGSLGRPLNGLGVDVEGDIVFENGGTIKLDAGIAQFVPDASSPNGTTTPAGKAELRCS